jgi:hypothetical protein
MRQNAGFHVVARLAQLAYLIIDVLDLIIKLNPALNALF